MELQAVAPPPSCFCFAEQAPTSTSTRPRSPRPVRRANPLRPRQPGTVPDACIRIRSCSRPAANQTKLSRTRLRRSRRQPARSSAHRSIDHLKARIQGPNGTLAGSRPAFAVSAALIQAPERPSSTPTHRLPATANSRARTDAKLQSTDKKDFHKVSVTNSYKHTQHQPSIPVSSTLDHDPQHPSSIRTQRLRVTSDSRAETERNLHLQTCRKPAFDCRVGGTGADAGGRDCRGQQTSHAENLPAVAAQVALEQGPERPWSTGNEKTSKSSRPQTCRRPTFDCRHGGAGADAGGLDCRPGESSVACTCNKTEFTPYIQDIFISHADLPPMVPL